MKELQERIQLEKSWDGVNFFEYYNPEVDSVVYHEKTGKVVITYYVKQGTIAITGEL